jgi:hypothetical protein
MGMATKRCKRVNPFYLLLVVAGTLFTVTACAYGVMAVKQLHASDFPVPGQARPMTLASSDVGFVQFMDEHGVRLMLGELAVLGLACFAAMGTDRLWAGDE